MKFKLRALNISFGYFHTRTLIKKQFLPQQVVTFNFFKNKKKGKKNNLKFPLENYLFQIKKFPCVYLYIFSSPYKDIDSKFTFHIVKFSSPLRYKA